MLSIGNQFDAKEFRESVNLVNEKLDASMDDPLFREYWLSVARRTPRPEVSPEAREIARAALLVGNAYEELGILLKNDIIDKHMFLDRYCFVIERNWTAMLRLLAWMRETTRQFGIWENFEYLTVLSQDFSRARSTTYPPGVRRLKVECPWPVPAPAV
jgi:hypothetical protein